MTEKKEAVAEAAAAEVAAGEAEVTRNLTCGSPEYFGKSSLRYFKRSFF